MVGQSSGRQYPAKKLASLAIVKQQDSKLFDGKNWKYNMPKFG